MAKQVHRPRGEGMPARSVRIPDDIWEKSKLRAKHEGTTVSHVIYTILEGYSKGLFNPPRVEVRYDQPKV